MAKISIAKSSTCKWVLIIKMTNQTLEDLVPVLGNRRPEEDGVGVVGRQSEPRPVGEIIEEDETASENLDAATSFEEGDDSSPVSLV